MIQSIKSRGPSFINRCLESCGNKVVNPIINPLKVAPVTIQSMLIYQLEVCQEGGVKKGGTWMTLRIPDWRHGGYGHS